MNNIKSNQYGKNAQLHVGYQFLGGKSQSLHKKTFLGIFIFFKLYLMVLVILFFGVFPLFLSVIQPVPKSKDFFCLK